MKETGTSDKQKDRRQTLDRLFFDPENNVNNVTNDILIRTENNVHKRKFKILRNLIWKCFLLCAEHGTLNLPGSKRIGLTSLKIKIHFPLHEPSVINVIES